MYIQKVSPQDIFDRINADAYAPHFVKSMHCLKNSGLNLSTLGEVVCKPINNSIRGVTGELNNIGSTIPMFRPADISDGEAHLSSAPKLSADFESGHIKSRVYPGDLVLGIAGSVGVVGRVPKETKFGNINGSSARISTDEDYRNAYLLGYLQSNYGQSSMLKFGVGSVQKHLNLEDLPKVVVLLPSELTQKYIGDKVRQAERLRAWAKCIEEKITLLHQRYIPEQQHLDFVKKTRIVSSKKMAERLDAHFYPAVVEDYLEQKGIGIVIKLVNLASIFNGQTQPEICSLNSCEQITVTNLSPSFLVKKLRQVEIPKSNEKFTLQHDLLICNAAHNKSYIGRDITYCSSEEAYLPSTEVMVIRVNRKVIPASFVRSYLLSKVGYIQIQSTIRGITAHSYPADMLTVSIPFPDLGDEEKLEWFASDDELVKAGIASEISTKLVILAKLLVEDLIEGQLTESQLVAAYQAREGGDYRLDHALLARMTTKGIDGDGTALFDDLEQLEDLLQQAELAMQEV